MSLLARPFIHYNLPLPTPSIYIYELLRARLPYSIPQFRWCSSPLRRDTAPSSVSCSTSSPSRPSAHFPRPPGVQGPYLKDPSPPSFVQRLWLANVPWKSSLFFCSYLRRHEVFRLVGILLEKHACLLKLLCLKEAQRTLPSSIV